MGMRLLICPLLYPIVPIVRPSKQPTEPDPEMFEETVACE